MKITVLADDDGTIVAATYASPSQDTTDDSNGYEIVPSPTQCLHELDAPDELIAHMNCESFTEEIFCYCVGMENGVPRLMRQ